MNLKVLKWTNKLCYVIIFIGALQLVAFKGMINGKVMAVLMFASVVWSIVSEYLIRKNR